MSESTSKTYHCPQCFTQLRLGFSRSTLIPCPRCRASFRVPVDEVAQSWAALVWVISWVLVTLGLFLGLCLPGHIHKLWASAPDGWYSQLLASLFASGFACLIPAGIAYFLALHVVRDE